MLRKLLAGILLTTFLVATTGFVLVQCCCDVTPNQSCCKTKSSDGCKSDVSYFKLKSDYQQESSQPITFFAVCLGTVLNESLTAPRTAVATRAFDDTGPPLYDLTALSRLQVFRV